MKTSERIAMQTKTTAKRLKAGEEQTPRKGGRRDLKQAERNVTYKYKG